MAGVRLEGLLHVGKPEKMDRATGGQNYSEAAQGESVVEKGVSFFVAFKNNENSGKANI